MSKGLIKILGIDPGVNHTGYSIGLFDPKTDTLNIKEYGVFSASTIAKKNFKQDFKTYGNIISLTVYEQEFEKILDSHHPDYVVSESAFFNPRMPNAFLSLSLCINTIRTILYRRQQILYTVAPKEAKQTVSTATANKAAVQESIHHLKDLSIKHTRSKPQEKMVEHEADSIAIMYTFCKNTLRAILMGKSSLDKK